MRAAILPCLVEGLEFVQPDAALVELGEPALDERLRLRVALAAASVGDPEPREDELERAGGERRAVIGAERERPGAIWRALAAHWTSAIASVARQRSSRCQPTISRVQQSMAAIR
jgi:hypothetical protein